jgi:hypothetical protein
MQKQIQFQVSDIGSALELTKHFFVNQEFKIAGQTGSAITFTKGSVLRNMTSFNPLNWKSKVEVSALDNILTADFEIDTIGQIVTPKEEALWNTFIEKYKVSILEKTDVRQEISQELRRTQQSTWKYVGWAFVGGVMGAIPFTILAMVTGLNVLAPIGTAGGAILFMMNRINKDRQKPVNGS